MGDLENIIEKEGEYYRRLMVSAVSGYFIVWLNIHKYLPQKESFISLKYMLLTAFWYLAWEIIQMIYLNIFSFLFRKEKHKLCTWLTRIITILWILALIITINYGCKSIFGLMNGIEALTKA